ncbi:glutathione S-transferase [Actibacterium mucosum KCTC 23349]|uniref:Glutathione S-transferase n=1 Tax=Actibacterium mucosum KCTC 23349 TaxID=1454373 RepID=A0A037ZJ45_9RHOB|nr:glutathione S-transferase family protein [Actibacterium mucosum]KAJ55577.1 glutathione S-transferase [Actibacterium mucosum KCTC 23349]
MIRLHHCPETRSMRTLWLLHELGVEFDVITLPFDKTLRSPEFLELNPAGRVPALEIDGTVMFETGAITEYLCERFREAGMGRAPGDPDRRDWLVWMHFAETISQHTAALTQQHVAIYPPEKRSPLVTRLEAKRLEKTFNALEGRLTGRDYLLDSGFSAADVSVGQAVYMGMHYVRLEPFPAISAWWARVTARPAYQAALPKDGEGRLYPEAFYEPLAD